MVRRSQTVLEDDEWSASLDYAGGAPKDLHLSPLDVNLDECDGKIIWDEIIEPLSLYCDNVDFLELGRIISAPKAAVAGIRDDTVEADLTRRV
jgi:hypothetical protein